MKISGFSFVKNAVSLGYPVVESLRSLLPVCDELVIAVGKSDDDTLTLIRNIGSPKIKIIETVWDSNMKFSGTIYSHQTNIALSHCTGDWCIYLQADEVLHEDDYTLLYDELKSAYNNKRYEALLFRYNHFYGAYNYTGSGRQWYRREIRALKNTGKVTSWGDAQGFRKNENDKISKLKARQTDIRIFHYGWVRPPKIQNKKILASMAYYDGLEYDIECADNFDYNTAYELKPYYRTHPAIMEDRIKQDGEWTKFFDPTRLRKKPFLVKATDYIEELSGWRIGEYKDFIEVR